MNRRTAGALVLTVWMVSGFGCITVQPNTDTEVEEAEVEDTCDTCIQVCQVVANGVLVCEAECKSNRACPAHDAKDRASRRPRALMNPPPPSAPSSGMDEGVPRSHEL